jgi:hypothetical protein
MGAGHRECPFMAKRGRNGIEILRLLLVDNRTLSGSVGVYTHRSLQLQLTTETGQLQAGRVSKAEVLLPILTAV